MTQDNNRIPGSDPGEELTPEEKRDVFYCGGRRAVVRLAGRDIVLGELAHKDRYKIFECFERDIASLQKSYKEYVLAVKPSIFKVIAAFFRTLFGIEKKIKPAVSVMKKFVEGLTENDVILIQVCAEGRNEMTSKQIREIVMSSPPSEVQVAIQKALELNGIDTKKFLAARKMTVPSDAA